MKEPKSMPLMKRSAARLGKVLLGESKEIGRVAGRGLLVAGMTWALQKGLRKAWRKGEHEGSILDEDFGKKIISKATDHIIGQALGGKEKEPREDSAEYVSIMRHLHGMRYSQEGYDAAALDFPPQWNSMVRVMLFRFWHEPERRLKRVIHWEEGTANPPRLVSVNVGEEEPCMPWEEGCVYGYCGELPVIMALRFYGVGGIFGGCLEVMSPTRKEARQTLKEFEVYLATQNYLRGKVVNPNGNLQEYRSIDRLSWDDLLLPAEFKQELYNNTLGFIGILDPVRAHGLRAARGNLWRGKSGVGKTMAARIVAQASNGQATFISVPAPSIQSDNSRGQLGLLFRMGRWLAPTILFFDDIHHMPKGAQKQLLHEMDGMENNDGLVIIATANGTSDMDLALIDRPGRFDVVLDFPTPGCAARLQVFSGLLDGKSVAESTISSLVEASKGLSVVHCEEIVRRAQIRALLNGKDSVGDYLMPAADEVAEMHRRLEKEEEGGEDEASECREVCEEARESIDEPAEKDASQPPLKAR